jgi:uncharacterized membrane protein
MAASFFAVGACFKLWPALLLLPLLGELVFNRERRRAAQAALVAAVVSIGVNLPFAVANLRGWYAPFAFQDARPVDITTNSIWYWDARHLGTQAVNELSTVLIGAGLLGIFALAWRQGRRRGAFPFVQTSAAMVLWYLLAGKTFSPQYALWLLPFLALVKVSPRLWVQFALADAALYSWWLVHPAATWPLGAVVFWRAGIVAVLLIKTLYGELAFAPSPVGRLRPNHSTAPLGSARLVPAIALRERLAE